MSNSATSQEPSMEEILASIRRIISDDEGEAPAEATETAEDNPGVSETDLDALFSEAEDVPSEQDETEAANEGGADVLQLTDDLAIETDHDETPSIVEPEIVEAIGDIDFMDDTPAQEETGPAVEETETLEPEHGFNSDQQLAETGTESLLSSEANAAASAAFDNLAKTILSQNARTLEDLVGEMLRPMLKSWLDENLPALVERLVRAEIERVSRSGPR